MSMLRRLRSFSALDPAEQDLALRAHAWLLWTRVILSLASFTRTREWVAGGRGGRTSAGPTPDWPRAVRRAMRRAARTFPGSSCLARALVAERLLRAGGHEAKLTIGVADPTAPARPARRSVDAHAWVESGRIIVVGEEEAAAYTPLAVLGGER